MLDKGKGFLSLQTSSGADILSLSVVYFVKRNFKLLFCVICEIAVGC